MMSKLVKEGDPNVLKEIKQLKNEFTNQRTPILSLSCAISR
jgi:hypothetical protein